MSRRRWRALGLAVVVACAPVALVVGSQPATGQAAAFPGAYAWSDTVDRGDTFRLLVKENADAAPRVLAPHTYGRAAFSPDAGQVAYTAPVTDSSDGRWQLEVQNLDGSGRRAVTAPRVGDFDPAWSPDGRWIAVSRDERGNFEPSCCTLWLIGMDGQGEVRLDAATSAHQPAWSPDGRALAYAAPDGIHVYVIGETATRLVTPGAFSWPAYAPDGSVIAAARRTGPESGTVSLLPAGGGAASDTSAGSTGGRPQTPVFVDPGSFLHLDVAGQGENGRTISLVRRTEVSGAPTGVLQTGRPMYYLAWSPGWRAGKPQPAPRSIAQACPPDTPPSGFSDVPPGSTHAAAVDCAVRWGVVRGTSPTSYSPERGVPRDQMAAFVARTVEATGAQLPEPSRDHFSDDDQSVHEQAINALAEAGIVNGRTPGAYAPGVLVTRAQMAAFLVRAWDVVAAQTGTEPLPPSEDWFFDDAATPLRTDIDKAAGVGFTGGTGPGRYSPYEGVQRGQMASFVVRLLDLAVERGVAQAPPPA